MNSDIVLVVVCSLLSFKLDIILKSFCSYLFLFIYLRHFSIAWRLSEKKEIDNDGDPKHFHSRRLVFYFLWRHKSASSFHIWGQDCCWAWLWKWLDIHCNCWKVVPIKGLFFFFCPFIFSFSKITRYSSLQFFANEDQ